MNPLRNYEVSFNFLMFPVLANEAVGNVCLAYSNVLASVYKNNTALRLTPMELGTDAGGREVH